jgi:hypothetical protein
MANQEQRTHSANLWITSSWWRQWSSRHRPIVLQKLHKRRPAQQIVHALYCTVRCRVQLNNFVGRFSMSRARLSKSVSCSLAFFFLQEGRVEPVLRSNIRMMLYLPVSCEVSFGEVEELLLSCCTSCPRLVCVMYAWRVSESAAATHVSLPKRRF